ncbi:MAG: EscR/YscR/HrcR family type III secretion system export apparatus protein, partial [Lachnospiraceae bacterium]|nr:EscR/YscR/HrcR family type III secretion system export apparatus protein [Lachnospiraceae bacterium]
MKKYFSGYQVKRILCLLFLAGILFITVFIHEKDIVQASGLSHVDSNLTGDTVERTNINEPGESESADDLQELNIANTVTVTYNDGNGTLNGALRILLTLTLIAIAPSLIVMLTSFTRIIIVLHFTRAALNTQTAPPNNVMIGLALFLTFFIMQPTLSSIYT